MNLFKDIQGKVAIVTGSAQGIGKAIAESLIIAGAKVLAVDIMESIKTGERINWFDYKADISKSSSVNSMVDYCLENIGSPDILLNIAAISTPSLVKDMDIETWCKSIDVNLTSVFLCTHAVLPYMIEKRSGVIINFSSVIARTGGKTSSSYAAAKSGIEGFSKSLAQEVGPFGIRVNVIAPGMVETRMLELMPIDQKKKLINKLPLNRVGNPHDFIGLTLLLASDAGNYITGQTIHVNGGLYMN